MPAVIMYRICVISYYWDTRKLQILLAWFLQWHGENQMLLKSKLNFTNSKGNNMRHHSCHILYCNGLKKWFCCKDCNAHTASVLQDGCVTVSVQFLHHCHFVNIWLKQLLTSVNIS